MWLQACVLADLCSHSAHRDPPRGAARQVRISNRASNEPVGKLVIPGGCQSLHVSADGLVRA
eukprot:920513-Prymnesium_polylepis.1